MRFLRAFNKEQITLAAAAGICLVMLGRGVLGLRVSGVEVAIDAPDRAYARPPLRFAEFVQEDFVKAYGPGEDIWKPEYTQRLPVPSVPPPEPRPGLLAAPCFRPGPVSEVYNRLAALKVKYPPLVSGAPQIPEASAPPAAEVAAVLKLEEPSLQPRPDRRAEREREFYTVELVDGTRIEGEFSARDDKTLTLRDRKDNQRKVYPLNRIRRELPNWTNEERYQRESRGIKPGPGEAPERLRLALWCYDEVGMVQEAEAEAKAAVGLRKDFLEGYLLLGRIAVDRGDLDGAIAAYESGIAGGASAAELYYEIGRCCRMMGALEEPWLEVAQAMFEKALEASPRHQRAKVALARVLLDRGKDRSAIETASDFFAKLGNAPDTRVPEKVEAFLVRGLAMLRMGELEKARGDLGEAHKMVGPYLETLRGTTGSDPSPSKPPAWVTAEAVRSAEIQCAEALNALGVLEALEGRYSAAAQGFMGALKVHQYLTDAWTNLGVLLLLSGRWNEAEAVFQAASQRDPVSAEALLGLGLAQVMAGKADGAAWIEKALQVDPRHTGAKVALAHLRLQEPGREEEALKLYREALRSDFAYLPAYYGAALAHLRLARKLAGEALAEMGREEARSQELARKAREYRGYAETLLRRLKAADPGQADVLVALGCVQALLDRPEEAMESLRAAAQILQQKMDPLLHYAIGYVEYWYPATEPDEKRLEKALSSFTRCTNAEVAPGDTFGAEVVKEARKIIEDIADWKVTSLRVDDRFEREPGDPGGGWLRMENYGVKIEVVSVPGKGGRCRFSGIQARADMGITMLDRQIPSEHFYALELVLIPERIQGSEFGVSIYTSQQGNTRIGFHVGFNDKGKAYFNPNLSYPNDMDLKDMVIVKWTEIKTPPPNPAEILLRIARVEKDRRPLWNIYWWDPSKGEWLLAQKEIPAVLAGGAAARQWTVSVWSRTLRGQAVSLDLDNVRIYERTRR